MRVFVRLPSTRQGRRSGGISRWSQEAHRNSSAVDSVGAASFGKRSAEQVSKRTLSPSALRPELRCPSPVPDPLSGACGPTTNASERIMLFAAFCFERLCRLCPSCMPATSSARGTVPYSIALAVSGWQSVPQICRRTLLDSASDDMCAAQDSPFLSDDAVDLCSAVLMRLSIRRSVSSGK